jgi:DNA-binding response OmpR family regulator
MRAAWLAGAMDYLKEPWEPEELFLRIRGPRTAAVSCTWQGKSLRLEGIELRADDRTVQLSAAEAELMRMLIKRRGMAVPRRILAWAAGCTDGRVVDTLISRIRVKLAEVAGTSAKCLVAIRGVGYSFPCTILGLVVSLAP